MFRLIQMLIKLHKILFSLKHSKINLGLWFKGACRNHNECSDVVDPIHAKSQIASSLCTNNGITYFAKTGCTVRNTTYVVKMAE